MEEVRLLQRRVGTDTDGLARGKRTSGAYFQQILLSALGIRP